MKTVDARGLSCPQPVIMTLGEIRSKEAAGELEVLVDTQTSVENVSRLASSQGWKVKSVDEDCAGAAFRMILCP